MVIETVIEQSIPLFSLNISIFKSALEKTLKKIGNNNLPFNQIQDIFFNILANEIVNNIDNLVDGETFKKQENNLILIDKANITDFFIVENRKNKLITEKAKQFYNFFSDIFEQLDLLYKKGNFDIQNLLKTNSELREVFDNMFKETKGFFSQVLKPKNKKYALCFTVDNQEKNIDSSFVSLELQISPNDEETENFFDEFFEGIRSYEDANEIINFFIKENAVKYIDFIYQKYGKNVENFEYFKNKYFSLLKKYQNEEKENLIKTAFYYYFFNVFSFFLKYSSIDSKLQNKDLENGNFILYTTLFFKQNNLPSKLNASFKEFIDFYKQDVKERKQKAFSVNNQKALEKFNQIDKLIKNIDYILYKIDNDFISNGDYYFIKVVCNIIFISLLKAYSQKPEEMQKLKQYSFYIDFANNKIIPVTLNTLAFIVFNIQFENKEERREIIDTLIDFVEFLYIQDEYHITIEDFFAKFNNKNENDNNYNKLYEKKLLNLMNKVFPVFIKINLENSDIKLNKYVLSDSKEIVDYIINNIQSGSFDKEIYFSVNEKGNISNINNFSTLKYSALITLKKENDFFNIEKIVETNLIPLSPLIKNQVKNLIIINNYSFKNFYLNSSAYSLVNSKIFSHILKIIDLLEKNNIHSEQYKHTAVKIFVFYALMFNLHPVLKLSASNENINIYSLELFENNFIADSAESKTFTDVIFTFIRFSILDLEFILKNFNSKGLNFAKQGFKWRARQSFYSLIKKNGIFKYETKIEILNGKKHFIIGTFIPSNIVKINSKYEKNNIYYFLYKKIDIVSKNGSVYKKILTDYIIGTKNDILNNFKNQKNLTVLIKHNNYYYFNDFIESFKDDKLKENNNNFIFVFEQKNTLHNYLDINDFMIKDYFNLYTKIKIIRNEIVKDKNKIQNFTNSINFILHPNSAISEYSSLEEMKEVYDKFAVLIDYLLSSINNKINSDGNFSITFFDELNNCTLKRIEESAVYKKVNLDISEKDIYNKYYLVNYSLIDKVYRAYTKKYKNNKEKQ